MSQCHWSSDQGRLHAVTLHFEKFGPSAAAANEAGHGALEFNDLLGGRVFKFHILDQLGRYVHGRSFDGLASEMLLVDGKISGTVVFVFGSGMFRVNVRNELAMSLLNFCFAGTSTALYKGT